VPGLSGTSVFCSAAAVGSCMVMQQSSQIIVRSTHRQQHVNWAPIAWTYRLEARQASFLAAPCRLSKMGFNASSVKVNSVLFFLPVGSLVPYTSSVDGCWHAHTHSYPKIKHAVASLLMCPPPPHPHTVFAKCTLSLMP
jgi:hypothetical protein